MRFLSFDIETTGDEDEFALQPWRVQQMRAWITTFSIAFRSDDDKMDARVWIMPHDAARITTQEFYDQTRAKLKAVLDKAFAEKYVVLGWNVTFDVAWLLAYGLKEEVFRLKWLDVMRVWRHLDIEPTWMGQRRYTLDMANKTFEPVYADYKHDVDYHDTSISARKKLANYNKKDTMATLLHMERFWPQLTDRQQLCAKIEANCIPTISEANLLGLHVSDENVMVLDALMRNIAHRLSEKLAPHNCTEKMIRSPAKLRKLFFERWNLPVIKYTIDPKTGLERDTPSTDKEVLHELATDDERVEWVGQWREALNLRSKFITSLRRSVIYNGETNVSHPQAIVFGTYTSRMTYSAKQGRGEKALPIGFALHQMKRDKRFRNSIVAPPGHLIVEADAAGQEFRWMAIMSGEQTMLSLCESGGDPHSFLASEIYGEGYETLKLEVKSKDKEIATAAGLKRSLGKVGNLSLQYRTSRKKLRIVAKVQYGMPMSVDLADHTWKTYRQSYVGVPVYWSSQIELAKVQGYVETIPGRRVRIEGDWEGPHSWAMESTAINDPIQGTGGEQKYLALMMLESVMLKFGARLGWDLHDGIYFIVPEAKAMLFAHTIKKILDTLPYKRAWGFVSPIPLPWDVKVGPAWGSLTEIEA